ncbi:MAG TPA: glycosyltransferase family 4 protein [Paludibacter sp.]
MKKEIIIFSYDFPPSDGGIARLCSEIASNLHERDYNVQVLTTEHKGENKAPYNIKGIPVLRKTAKRIICEWKMFYHLVNIKNKIDYIILCGLWYPEALIALLAGFKNVYILTHAAELRPGKSAFRKNIWIPIIANWVLRSAKRVIANSEYTANLSKTVAPKAIVVTLPLAVNHNYFTPNISSIKNSEYLIISTVSRICKFKGHDTILEAIQQLPIEIRNKIRWKIAGNGPYKQTLIKLVEESGLSSQIEFLGFVPDEELPIVYQSSDVFVLCTREDSDSNSVEGFGLVFLEAQACGIPAIGTRAGGIPSAIKEENGGWLIKNKDDLSKLFINLINDQSICEQMGRKARLRVERETTWNIYINKLIKYLEI